MRFRLFSDWGRRLAQTLAGILGAGHPGGFGPALRPVRVRHKPVGRRR